MRRDENIFDLVSENIQGSQESTPLVRNPEVLIACCEPVGIAMAISTAPDVN